MNTVIEEMSARGSDPGRDRSIRALVAAALTIVTVVALVLVLGVDRPPALTLLADEPDPMPTGGVAWTAWDDADGGACVHVAMPDGTVRRLDCMRDGGEVVAWTDAGIMVRSWRGASEVVVVLDPSTGEVLERRATDADRHVEDPEAVFGEREGAELVVRLAHDPDQVVWRVDAPENYEITTSVRSDDDRWVAMTDSADRLLLVASDGSMQPRVWSTDAVRWSRLVWESTRE